MDGFVDAIVFMLLVLAGIVVVGVGSAIVAGIIDGLRGRKKGDGDA